MLVVPSMAILVDLNDAVALQELRNQGTSSPSVTIDADIVDNVGYHICRFRILGCNAHLVAQHQFGSGQRQHIELIESWDRNV